MNKIINNIEKIVHARVIREECQELRVGHLILDLLDEGSIGVGLERIVTVSEVVVVIPIRLADGFRLDLLRKKLDIEIGIIVGNRSKILLNLVDVGTDFEVVGIIADLLHVTK